MTRSGKDDQLDFQYGAQVQRGYNPHEEIAANMMLYSSFCSLSSCRGKKFLPSKQPSSHPDVDLPQDADNYYLSCLRRRQGLIFLK